MPGRDSKRNQYGNYGYANGRNTGPPRNHVIPTEPPYTAYIGNAPDSMVQGDFENHLFVGLKVKQVRLVRDRQTDRFRGFAYVDFEDEDSLRRAIALDGTCVNDRPIRIDVAARPLGANKNEGFRNKSGFESRDGRRVPSGNNNNRPTDGFRPGGRRNNNYNHEENFHHFNDSHNQDGYKHDSYPERTHHLSGSDKNHEHHQQRKISNDDVFIGPDTPASNEDSTDQNTTASRQASRNWADCPIDETTTEPSPPPSADNTFNSDDFQIVRNKNVKARTNQQSSSRPMGGQYSRGGRNNGNNYRGGSSEMAGGRNYYEQNSAQYTDHSQPFYHQQQNQGSSQNHIGSSYRSNNNNRQAPSSGSRQRLNSNRSNTSRNNNDDNERTKQNVSESSNDINNNSVSSENRPRLQLLPRSQKAASSVEDKPTSEPSTRNASIFGCGKPRDERDPKIAELNKHIEEVVEQEQHLPRTKSTTSDGSIDVVTKPVRILTAAKESLVSH